MQSDKLGRKDSCEIGQAWTDSGPIALGVSFSAFNQVGVYSVGIPVYLFEWERLCDFALY